MLRATSVTATVLVTDAVMMFELTVVTGASMEPALRVGDVVVSIPWREPAAGDVIVFEADDLGRVVHRVVRVGADGVLVTRGDANRHTDRCGVRPGSVRGTVVAVLPFGGLLDP